jgi:hypothetical protein
MISPSQHDGPTEPGLDLTAANIPIPLPALLVLAVLDLACVFAVTLRWLPPRPTPLFLAVAMLNGLLIGLLLGVQTWFWRWARKSSLARRSRDSGL